MLFRSNDIRTDEVEFSHEAKIGKISDKEIFYLMSRGLSEEDAKAMIVRQDLFLLFRHKCLHSPRA